MLLRFIFTTIFLFYCSNSFSSDPFTNEIGIVREPEVVEIKIEDTVESETDLLIQEEANEEEREVVVEKTNSSCSAVMAGDAEIVAEAPPETPILSPAANSEPDPLIVEGPMWRVLPSTPYTTAVVVLPPDPLLIVLPAANVPVTDSTGTALILIAFTKISV